MVIITKLPPGFQRSNSSLFAMFERISNTNRHGNTVKAYRAIIASKGVSYEALLSSPEEEPERFFVSKKPEEDDRMSTLEDAFKNADGELGKVGVTKFLLWNEYRLSNPDGYSYP